MQLTVPPAAAIAAFVDALDQLAGGDERLLLAVSGGPDSLALLLLAQAAITDRIEAATVDHGLRAEASAEADYVAQICDQRRIVHRILRPETPISGSVQANARAARYALLESHAAVQGCSKIATAHHADDQLETVLMRVARGSGIDGLAAIRTQRGPIIRPLLGFSKAELVRICADCNVQPVDDPSNQDASFDRVAMRQWLESGNHPFDAKRAVATAQSFAEASDALQWMTENLMNSRFIQKDGHAELDMAGIPAELRRRLVIHIIGMIQPGHVPRGDAVESALKRLDRGGKAMLGNVLCAGGTIWHFSLAPPRRHGNEL